MNPNWIERLAGSTRGTMLALLRRSKHTISELASALGITDNAVRTHIASLQRDGLVEQAGVRRDQRGKPAHVFDLTTTAEELFPKAYAAILKELIVRLEERDGPESVDELLRGIGAQIGAHHFREDATLAARVDAAAAALRSLGGEIRIEPAEGGF